MTIEKGSIYGLLGPSGCGKSTLLSCIVGRLSLDSGSVLVGINDKKQLGFMPQDIALNTELTICELLTFYGRLYLMSHSKITQRLIELTELLELPNKNRLVGDCSGGQQRRVSMAITLIHDPVLLIMDEPTVGIDPLLCASIWECFTNLVKNRGKTIVITTHYIEEAKSADRIGLMRNGKLLSEDSPLMLMKKFHCDSLEEVFLSLSKNQENEVVVQDYPPKQKQKPVLSNSETLNTVRYMAQLQKNWTWTKRNLGITLFVFLIPTICLVLFLSTDIMEIVTVPIGIVMPSVDFCPSNELPIRSCLKINDFTCRYVEILQSKYPLLLYDNNDTAIYEAKKGRLAAILYFHENFTQGMMERLEKQSGSSLKALEEGTMYASFDMSSYPISYRMIARVYVSLENLLSEICLQCNIDKRLARIPIGEPEAVHGSRDWQFQDSFVPAVVLPFVFYTMFIYSSSALSMELSSGLIERYQCAGLTLIEILVAQISLQLFVINLQNIFMIAVVYGTFGMIMVGSFGTIYLIIFLCELFGLFFGMFIALLVQNETGVSCVGVFLQLVAFIYCGCVWPIEGQHWLVQTMSRTTFPLASLSQGYFNVALRGWGITNPRVYLSIIWTILGSVILAVMTAVLQRLNIIKV
ncbi:ATP-Hypothetical protein cassette sub-family A ABC1 member [Nesidiocoris tenuis]|nr:ATP-Hypothetical protein cassette sub-family A ABC1 member [Nesidiocoris tenuis]